MTLVVGTVLHDGAIVAADCRVTWQAGGKPLITDQAQKLFSIGGNHAIAVAGSMETIQLLLPHLQIAFRTRRTDAVSVKRWLPGFLRETYRAAARQFCVRGIDVTVAASIRVRPTRIARARVQQLLRQTAEAGNRLGALRCIEALTSGTDPTIQVPESSTGVLYRMVSPAFKAEECKPFQVLSGGSGHRVKESVQSLIPKFAFATSNEAASWILEGVGRYLAGQDDGGAGGAVLIAHAHDGGVTSIVNSMPVVEGKGFTVRLDSGKFVIRNEETGEEVRLRSPLELLRAPPKSPLVFDALRDLFRDSDKAGGTIPT